MSTARTSQVVQMVNTVQLHHNHLTIIKLEIYKKVLLYYMVSLPLLYCKVNQCILADLNRTLLGFFELTN